MPIGVVQKKNILWVIDLTVTPVGILGIEKFFSCAALVLGGYTAAGKIVLRTEFAVGVCKRKSVFKKNIPRACSGNVLVIR